MFDHRSASLRSSTLPSQFGGVARDDVRTNSESRDKFTSIARNSADASLVGSVEVMRPNNQDDVCEFVRQIVSTRTGEPLTLTGRPDRDHRDVKAVEELWESPQHRFAVEHTVIESFSGQLANIAKIKGLLVPVKDMLAGRLPGRFALTVREAETSAARIDFAVAHREIARLVLDVAGRLSVGETARLTSEVLPFEHRHRGGSRRASS